MAGLIPKGAPAVQIHKMLLCGLWDYRKIMYAGTLTTVDQFVFNCLIQGTGLGELEFGAMVDIQVLGELMRKDKSSGGPSLLCSGAATARCEAVARRTVQPPDQ